MNTSCDGSQVLFVGFNAAYLRAIDTRVPTGSVIVVEEPDIIRKRGLEAAAEELECLDRIVPAAYQQSTEVVHAGAELNAARRVTAVVPGLEYAVPGAAALAAKLGLAGATEPAAQALRDKIRLREVAQAGGVQNPPWREVHCPRDILDFAGDRQVVLKPANRQASVGVTLMDRVSRSAAEQAWVRTSAAEEFEQVPDRPLNWRYLVEDRLLGPEYSVEALIDRGEVIFENITAKTVVAGPYPVELGHLVPAPLTPGTRSAFGGALRALVAALGFETGILHAEWILTTSGPFLLECAGRCPGDRLIDLIDLAYDTRLRLSLIDLLAGRPVTLRREPVRASAIRFLAARPGTVTGVVGVEATAALPGVAEVHIDAAPGSFVRRWESSWDRSGHVLVTGPDAVVAEQRAVQAAAAIRILSS